MCVHCQRAHVRANLRRLLVGMLVLIFFSLMAYDLLGFDEPTDNNVEVVSPEGMDSRYHNEDTYPVSERRPTYF